MRYKDFESMLPPEQRWENLTLANDFLFGRIMRDERLCTEMIRRILPHIDIESNSLKLNDGAVTIFLNTQRKIDDISGELKAFLDFMRGESKRRSVCQRA